MSIQVSEAAVIARIRRKLKREWKSEGGFGRAEWLCATDDGYEIRQNYRNEQASVVCGPESLSHIARLVDVLKPGEVVARSCR